MRYAVDIGDEYPLSVDETDFGSITPANFLAELYVPWDKGSYEGRLAHHLRTAKALVVVAGGRGGGKTSSLLAASKSLEDAPDAIQIIHLNVRRLYDRLSLQNLSREAAYAHLRSHLDLEIRRMLFPTFSDSLELLAWILAGPPDRDTPFEHLLLSDLHDDSIAALARAGVFAESRVDRYESLKDWLLTHSEEFAHLHNSLRDKYRARHSVLARSHLSNLDRIVLIYDNVDKIPALHQTVFVEVANDSQLAMGPLATSCVAIRTEHLRGGWEGQERGGSLVHLVLPNERQYNGVLLPSLEAKRVEQILLRRHLFALHKFKKKYPEEGAAQPIEVIHRVILEQFRESDIHRLTNENLRAIGTLYIGFMQFLYSLNERRRKSFRLLTSSEGKKHAHTLFYLWLRTHGPVANIHLYDVLRLVGDDSPAKGFRHMTSVHHFILTCTANLTDELKDLAGPRDFPTFSAVLGRLEELGFELDDVRPAVQEMLPDEEREGTLEFVDSDPTLGELSRDSTARLRLTKLGKILVTEVFSKVGYVWALAHAYGVKRGRQDPDLSYLEMNPWQRIAVIFEYVSALAVSHLTALRRLHTRWSEVYGVVWIDIYRSYFGIGGRVQVERILQEAAAFYGREFASRREDNTFDELQKIYATEVDRVRNGSEPGSGLTQSIDKLRQRLR